MGSTPGTQTVERALCLLEAAANIHELNKLAKEVDINHNTAYRLLSALVEWGYLRHIPRDGYYLGPKLLEMGFKYYDQLHLPSIARFHLERLTQLTHETTHLAVREGNQLMYIDKVAGSRNLQMISRIGGRADIQCTALGKSLISGLTPNECRNFFNPKLCKTQNSISNVADYLEDVRNTAKRGYSLDIEENEIGVRCIAAPLKDGGGNVVAAISISGASIYIDDERIKELIPFVKDTATEISKELGWNTSQDYK